MEPVSTNPLKTLQQINFASLDGKNSIEVIGQNVVIHSRGGVHNHGSSKVKLKNIVDYNWENRLYAGQLLAVHMQGKFIAYGIKVPKGSTNSGMVRVANRETEQRTLLRGMKGQVQDISFAHIPTQVILGCVDEECNMFVHNIEMIDSGITSTLLLHIVHNSDISISTYHRLIWCPYIPEEEQSQDSEDDAAKLLVLTHGCKAEMWNISMVNAKYGVGPHDPETIEEGYLKIYEHSQPIIDATFSADGTALATASLDGNVKFFQVYMHDNESKPRCLHEWQPHNGSPISSLFFLDDYSSYNPEAEFWKFAVTGTNNNSELKIWSCESWACLQTIQFTPDPSSKLTMLSLKAGIDQSAGYLLLSDIHNRILYVLQIQKNTAEVSACVTVISEFLLPSPILSFGIVDAGFRKLKCSNSTEDLYQLHDDIELEDGNAKAIVIRMYIVQPKSLQECHIVYQSNLSANSTSLSTITHDSLMFREGLTDVGSDGCESDDTVLKNTNHESQLTNPISDIMIKTDVLIQSNNQPLNLMTPDAFNSPVRKESIDTINAVDSAVILAKTKKDDDASSNLQNDDLITFQRAPKDNFASGGSSPSREVQEILKYDFTIPKSLDFNKLETEPLESEDFDFTRPKSLDFNKLEKEPLESEDFDFTRTKVHDFNKLETQPLESEPLDYESAIQNEQYKNGKVHEGDGWPNIPIMKIDEVRKTEEGRISNNNHVDNKYKELFDENDVVSFMHKDRTNMALMMKINTIAEAIRQQNNSILQLQDQVSTINSRKQTCDCSSVQTEIVKQFNETLSCHRAEQNSMLENWIGVRAAKDREYQEILMSTVSQIVGNNMKDKLDTIVSVEIQKNIIPAIIKALEPLKHQLHSELAQKLTATDHLLKENINKLIHSKTVMEVLANAVEASLRPSIERCYKDMISTNLLPSWERVCQAMFQQIHETFNQGTKEYTTCLEGYLDKQRRSQEKSKDIVTQLQTISDSVQATSEQLVNKLALEMQKQTQITLPSFQESIKKNIRQEIKEQIEKGFRSNAAILEDSVINAVKSRAVTPSPHLIDTQIQQSHIKQLLSQGQINSAFQQALSASDLTLVVYTCEKVNPQEIFNQTPCPLQQHVLLSLIQQLSADMSNHTELKYKYLAEAIMNLQASNPLTREHMPVVLKDLQKQLTLYMSSNPNNAMNRQMKMLLMATHSLLQ